MKLFSLVFAIIFRLKEVVSGDLSLSNTRGI